MEIDAKKIEELCERLEKRAAFWERYWTGRSLQDPDSGPIREAAALIRSQAAALAAEKRAREEAVGESAELCGRLRYNASIWQRKADDDHPLVKDQLDAANAIVRLAYQALGYCIDAKHAESVADELRRLLEKEKERAEAAETHSAELAKVLENILDTYRRVYYMPKPGDGKLMWKAIDEGRVILKTNGGR